MKLDEDVAYARKWFYVILAGVIAYGAVVFIFIV